MHPSGPALRRVYADAPTGQVHYYDAGGDGAPLLMLHQAPTASADHAATFPLFARAGVRVIAMDTPGMGMSDAPAWEPTLADYAGAALAVLDHAGVTCSDAFGHHTGAQIALAAAALAPHRFRKLVLYGAPLMSADERQRYWEAIVPRERDPLSFTPRPGGGHLSAVFARVEAAFGTDVAHIMVTSRLMAGPTLWYGHNAALTHDMTSDLVMGPHPLLLVTHPGEMLDANTRAAAAARPDADLVDLGIRCGLATHEAADHLVDRVVAFLKR